MLELTEEMIEKYDKLIWKKAREYKNQNSELFSHISLEDLHSEGMLTLSRCAAKYDPSLGKAQFITYLYIALKNDFAAYFRNYSRSFKISATANKQTIEVINLQKQNKTPEEIAKELNISTYDVLNAINRNKCSYSFDFIDDDKENTNWLNYLVVNNYEENDPYYNAMQYVMDEFIASDMLRDIYRRGKSMQLSKTTDEDDRKTIQRELFLLNNEDYIDQRLKELYCIFNGILGFDKMTFKEISEEYGLPLTSIRSIKIKIDEEIKGLVLSMKDELKELFNI